MATPASDLVDHLLDRISLSRSEGFTAVDFENAVHGFHARKNDALQDGEESITVNNELIESAFEDICKHADVEIRELDENGQSLDDQLDSYPTELQSNLAGKRIFTSEDRLWQTVAGHGVDPNRIPTMEFELLVVIAQHGPEGVLQPAAGKLAQQDKHSVPGRTDKLAKKGYISKDVVMAKSVRTSLLTLKKWSKGGNFTKPMSGLIYYDAIFDATIALLRANGNIIAVEDLYHELGADQKRKKKLVLRGCLRLAEVGCVRLLRCRVQDSEGNTVMLVRRSVERTARAVQLLREPTAEDKSRWLSYKSKENTGDGRSDKDESDVDSDLEDGGESAEDETSDSEDADIESSPATATPSATISRRSDRPRRKSSMAKTVDYALLHRGTYSDEEEDEDEDGEAEVEINALASSEVSRRPMSGTATDMLPPHPRTPTQPAKKLGRPRKTPQSAATRNGQLERPRTAATFESGSSVHTEIGEDASVPVPAGSSSNHITLTATETSADPGAALIPGPTSSKRERKKSTKALEADALRAAGEPLLTEPLDGFDLTFGNDDFELESSGATRGPQNSASRSMDVDVNEEANDVELDANGLLSSANKPRKKRGPYRPRNPSDRPSIPVVKKRDIPEEEYEDYERYAQAAAERQVRAEMKSGSKRTATMAQLGDVSESPTKVARTDDSEGTADQAQTSATSLPAARVAEVKAEILAREKPGVYINPPGARNLKLENYVQRGRPRNALIAVIKSEGLSEMPWFRDDGGPRFAPKSSRRRTARIGEGLIGKMGDKQAFSVGKSDSEGEAETRTRKKRRVGEGKFRLQTGIGTSTPAESDTRGSAMSTTGLDGASDEVNDQTPVPGRRLRQTSVLATGLQGNPAFAGFGDASVAEDNSRLAANQSGGLISFVQSNGTSAAALELEELHRKKGRPRKEDKLRLAILRRQILAEEAAQRNEARDAQESESIKSGNGPMTVPQETVTLDPPRKQHINAEQSQTAASPVEPGLDGSEKPDRGNQLLHGASNETIGEISKPTSVGRPSSTHDGQGDLEGLASAVTAIQPGARTKEATDTPALVSETIAEPSKSPVTQKTAGPANSNANEELNILLSIKPRLRTPVDLERIKALQAQVDDEYINGPGTLEELTTLRHKRGRKTAKVTAQILALEKQFPGVEAVQVHTQSQDHTAVQLDGTSASEDYPDEPTSSGPSNAPVTTPRVPSTAQDSRPSMEFGKLRTPQHTLMFSVQAPRGVLEDLDPSAIPPATQVNGESQADEGSAQQSTTPVIAAPPTRFAAPVDNNDDSQSAIASPAQNASTTVASEILFTKQYVEDHPEEQFHYRGRGRYGRGERFSQAYVDAHRNEEFYLVQDGSEVKRLPYARGPDPALRNQSRIGMVEERLDKAYVEAHPTEQFYHRGGGVYARGEVFSKEYVDAHPNEQFVPIRKGFIRAPLNASGTLKTMGPLKDAPLPAPGRPQTPSMSMRRTSDSMQIPSTPEVVGEGLAAWQSPASGRSRRASTIRQTPQQILITQQASTSHQTPTFPDSLPKREVRKAQRLESTKPQSYDIEHVESHPDETFHHRGGGHWYPGLPASGQKFSVRGPGKQQVTTTPTTHDSTTLSMQGVDRGNHAATHEAFGRDATPIPASIPENDVEMTQETVDQQHSYADTLVENDEESAHSSPATRPANRRAVEFPLDTTVAVVVQKFAVARQQEQPQPRQIQTKQPEPKQPQQKRSKKIYRSRLQTVSKSDDHLDDFESDEQQSDMQRQWESMSDHASALMIRPIQAIHSPSGTFATNAGNVQPKTTGHRTLRNRTRLARLTQNDDDFLETPGLVVTLKTPNLAANVAPALANRTGPFAANAANDAVPMSRLSGKPKRPHTTHSKRVTFQDDGDDEDEFQDEGEIEDEESDLELDMSDEETGVARPERRKRSVGANGEIRMRDMASGPAFKDADRLVVAFALVSAICGGLRVEGINWTLIAHALGFRYEGSFLRRRWDHFKRTRKPDVDALREAIHEPFLAAYEDDDFPRVDFQNLNNTDWPALFDWVQQVVVPRVRLQPHVEGPKVPDLLQSRAETEERYEVKKPAILFEPRLDDYFITPTEQNRRSLINKYTYGNALPGELRPKDQVFDDMALLKSWVRAVAVTKQYNYKPEAAAKKLRKFSSALLQKVTAEMIDSHMFSQERKNRMLPGRNYQIHNEVLLHFRRWPPRPDDTRFLRFVAQAWRNINSHFESHDQLSLIPSASDPEYLVLANMAAQGMLRIATALPEVKNHYDAPFPKLSPWGYCGPTYETKKVDMSKLKFPITYTKTAKYKNDHELLTHVPIPLQPPQYEGEMDVRIPFWVDIHGNLIDDVWDMVLRSILHILVFRSGTTAAVIEQAHGRKLWAWEIELVLEWMGKVGIATRAGTGEMRDGRWIGGWRAGEWWYCAFAPEIAVWSAPIVAELE